VTEQVISFEIVGSEDIVACILERLELSELPAELVFEKGH